MRKSIRQGPLDQLQLHAGLDRGACREPRVHIAKHRIETVDLALPLQRLVPDAFRIRQGSERESQDIGHVQNQLARRHAVIGKPDVLKTQRRIPQRAARAVSNGRDHMTKYPRGIRRQSESGHDDSLTPFFGCAPSSRRHCAIIEGYGCSREAL